jgi:diguanylate cyclase (GGDEF)-like protein
VLGASVGEHAARRSANLFLTNTVYTNQAALPAELDVTVPQDPTKAPACLADSAFEQMPYPVVILDEELRVCLANAQARARFEMPPAEDGAAPSFDAVLARSGHIPHDVRRRILSQCGAEIRNGDSPERDTLHEVSTRHAIALHIRPLGAARWMAVLDHREKQHDAHSLTETNPADHLIEIGDRRKIETKLTEILARGTQDQSPGVLVFDIDRFRAVNDRLGRRGGDALLRAVVGRARRAIRDADDIARLEGDNFAVLQHDGRSAGTLAARLVDLLSRPYLLRGEVVTIGVSVGVARPPADGQSAAVLLHHADFARREAKEAGGQTWRRYGQRMADRANARLELEADLRKALALGQLILNYQPRVDLRSRTVTGFEALARWTHPVRGPVPPSVFIPLAEDIGLIGVIGDWALRAACHDAAAWPETLTVAVNVSARQLDDGRHLVAQVAAALHDSGLPAKRLELEITETTLTRHPEEAHVLLRDLRGLGVRIAMDDFGTGYASLQQLRAFPFDTIKIDQSFVRSLDGNNDSSAVVRAIATLGTGLGMTVIAEGVETCDQARLVEAGGCTEIQGYLIGKPVGAAFVDGLLARDLTAALAN